MAFAMTVSALTGISILDGFIFLISTIIACLGATLLFTECRFWLQSRGNARRFQGHEPLTLPYSIPWLGSFFRMIDPHSLYEFARSRAPQQGPVRLRVGPLGIYILFGEKNIRMIFKNSKTLSKDTSTHMLFRNHGMRKPDLDVVAIDRSGYGSVPMVDIPDRQRIWKNSHEVGLTHLANNTSMALLAPKFMHSFIDELNKEPIGQSSVVPVYDYLRKVMFVGSGMAILGPELFRLNRDIVQTYWNYDEAFLLTVIGMPKLLYPKGHYSRIRLQNAVEKWIRSGWENLDEKDKDSDWEKNFGSRFTRETLSVMNEAGISHHGQAVAVMPMFFAINSNAIPCASWVILETLQRPGLLERLRAEVTPMTITDTDGNITVDIPKLLTQCPLLTSIFQECLRTRVSGTIVRQLTEDLESDGYILKKDSYIMSPSWIPSHGPLWDVPGHPADSFWPERFIEMPKLRPSDPEEKSQFDMAMKPDNFFPFGGGNVICTGRFFAKQEIMVAAALFIVKFEIEPQGWVTHSGKKADRAAKPDESYAGSGVLPPDRDMMVKIKRIK